MHRDTWQECFDINLSGYTYCLCNLFCCLLLGLGIRQAFHDHRSMSVDVLDDAVLLSSPMHSLTRFLHMYVQA
jgi:hypothetical protein